MLILLHSLSFGTIDGFQGQEKDIIILSTVRSGDHLSSIGFLRDVRRMNVALTRAKSSLFIVGNASTLERADEKWRTIVGNARERGFLVNVSLRRGGAPFVRCLTLICWHNVVSTRNVHQSCSDCARSEWGAYANSPKGNVPRHYRVRP